MSSRPQDRSGCRRAPFGSRRRLELESVARLTCCIGMLLGCSDPEDVAAIVLSDTTLAGDPGGASAERDAGVGGEGSASAGEAVVVLGHPLRAANWPDPLAAWPLRAPLAEFFASAEPGPVRVEGADGDLLRELWRAAERGEYGSRRNVVGVVDGAGDRYLLVFQAP